MRFFVLVNKLAGDEKEAAMGQTHAYLQGKNGTQGGHAWTSYYLSSTPSSRTLYPQLLVVPLATNNHIAQPVLEEHLLISCLPATEKVSI